MRVLFLCVIVFFVGAYGFADCDSSYDSCIGQCEDQDDDISCWGTCDDVYKACKKAANRVICMNECVGDSDYCNCKCDDGIVLNTNVPFIGRCISVDVAHDSGESEQLNAFPRLMQGLTRIFLSAILLLSFVLVIVGGVMIAAGGADSGAYAQ